MDGGAWQATVHGVTKGRTRLSVFTSLSNKKGKTTYESQEHFTMQNKMDKLAYTLFDFIIIEKNLNTDFDLDNSFVSKLTLK